jgi:uncharacterized membrane protein YtjA (UPF0391 family)
MLYYAAIFALSALTAALLGFTGAADAAAGLAKHLFVLFAVLASASLLVGLLGQP